MNLHDCRTVTFKARIHVLDFGVLLQVEADSGDAGRGGDTYNFALASIPAAMSTARVEFDRFASALVKRPDSRPTLRPGDLE